MLLLITVQQSSKVCKSSLFEIAWSQNKILCMGNEKKTKIPCIIEKKLCGIIMAQDQA